MDNFSLAPRNRNDYFAFQFTGYVQIPTTGQYTFYTASDDGSQLSIGSTLVVNNNGLHAEEERSGTINLAAGKHAITVTFFEKAGGEVLACRWSGPGIGKQAIPNSVLSRDGMTPPPPPTDPNPSASPAFYRAINLNGAAVTIDGNNWEGSTAGNYAYSGYSFTDHNVTLSPAPDASRTAMIRSSVYAKNLTVTLSSVPAGTYEVYLYVWEDNYAETYSISVEGSVVKQNHNSGAAGSWVKLGPYKTSVNDGSLDVTTSGGDANISGIEVWKSTTDPNPAPTPPPASAVSAYAINAGGSAAGSFTADNYVSGGNTYVVQVAINTSGVENPAPQGVYQTERYGDFTYTFPNLSPSKTYRIRLHFTENYFGSANQRKFNVDINGKRELSSFDVYSAAGAKNKALVREFMATPTGQGQISLVFSSVINNALINGIEVLEGSSTAAARMGIQEQWALSIHPNPTSQLVNLSLENAPLTEGYLTLTDLMGREKLSQVLSLAPGTNTLTLDIAELPVGIYWIKVIFHGKEVNEKLVISR